MTTVNIPDLKNTLISAVTQHDIRQSKRPGYNIYALPQYLDALSDVFTDIDNGGSLEASLRKNFNDRLLSCVLKAAGIIEN